MAQNDIQAALAASEIESPQLAAILARLFELKAENARLRDERCHLERRIAEERARCSDG